MKCRQLARIAGVASVPLLSALLPFNVPSTSAWAETGVGQMHFTLVAVSESAGREGVTHRMALNGEGKFGLEHVEGGGTFVLFNNAPAGNPKPILGFGSWKAKKF